MNATQHYHYSVVPTLQAYLNAMDDNFLGRKSDILKLSRAAESINDFFEYALADHYHELIRYFPMITFNKSSNGLNKLRDFLRGQRSALGLIFDIANCHKHKHISRTDRNINDINDLKENHVLYRLFTKPKIKYLVNKNVLANCRDGKSYFLDSTLLIGFETINKIALETGILNQIMTIEIPNIFDSNRWEEKPELIFEITRYDDTPLPPPIMYDCNPKTKEIVPNQVRPGDSISYQVKLIKSDD